MAQGKTFVCTHCPFEIMHWDDGNPYYLGEKGEKHYAYHPDPMREKCIGNDSDLLCLECGDTFKADPELSPLDCPACGSRHVARTSKLEGERCPQCKSGILRMDPEKFAIS